LLNSTAQPYACAAKVLRPDGSEAINDDQSCPIEDAEILGTEMANKILNSTPSNFFDWKS
jgi:hydroxymethylbilane synthase